MTQGQNPEIVDAGELADVLHVAPGTIRKWARHGVIPCLQITPKLMRFELNHVMDVLRQQSNSPDHKGASRCSV